MDPVFEKRSIAINILLVVPSFIELHKAFDYVHEIFDGSLVFLIY